MKYRWIAVVLILALGLSACAQKADAPAASALHIPAALKTTLTPDSLPQYDFTGQAMTYLAYIAEHFPNRCASDDASGHDAFGQWLLSELAGCGYDQVQTQDFEEKSMYDETVHGRNYILTVPGRSADKQIIVGAHYDGDGAGDNASGVALALATAAGLANAKPYYTIKFVFFDGEEDGLLGSKYYAGHMSADEIANTIYMINLDALVFGDYCNIYGGVYGDDYDAGYIALSEGEAVPEPTLTEGYDFAADTAEALGFRVHRTAELDGYFEKNGRGMTPEDAFFTNPWTNAHPAPENMFAASPATIGASDQAGFAVKGIPYIYFEATNWWAAGAEPSLAYTGYIETEDASLGDGGMFMNTEYDTLETLNELFPGRAEQHYHLFSPLLSALLLVKAE